MIQPLLTGLVEVTLWIAIFATATRVDNSTASTLGGFARESYLAYALWAAFIARISTSWMYEFRMIEEIDTGAVNSVLTRPISFYEYYLSQFFGYKLLTSAVSLIVPVAITFFIEGPTHLQRLPLAFALIIFYLVLVHTMSFAIASCGFFFNRIHSFTVAKNITLWLLSGELFPLDLVPEPWRAILLSLPFSSAVYVPVGYITGRLEVADVLHGFVTVAIGIAIMGMIARLLWSAGIRRYSGTGA